jgi:hypothetical protein
MFISKVSLPIGGWNLFPTPEECLGSTGIGWRRFRRSAARWSAHCQDPGISLIDGKIQPITHFRVSHRSYVRNKGGDRKPSSGWRARPPKDLPAGSRPTVRRGCGHPADPGGAYPMPWQPVVAVLPPVPAAGPPAGPDFPDRQTPARRARAGPRTGRLRSVPTCLQGRGATSRAAAAPFTSQPDDSEGELTPCSTRGFTRTAVASTLPPRRYTNRLNHRHRPVARPEFLGCQGRSRPHRHIHDHAVSIP